MNKHIIYLFIKCATTNHDLCISYLLPINQWTNLNH